MILCYGFVTKIVLITHQYSDYCWRVLAQHQGLLCFSLQPILRRGSWGWARSWEWTQVGQLTPTSWREITYYVMPWSAIKVQGKEEEREMFPAMISSQVTGHPVICWLSTFITSLPALKILLNIKADLPGSQMSWSETGLWSFHHSHWREIHTLLHYLLTTLCWIHREHD